MIKLEVPSPVLNIALCLSIVLLMLTGCSGEGDNKALFKVVPESAVVTLGETQGFNVESDGTFTWSVEGVLGEKDGTVVGTIDSDGDYKAPSDAGIAPEKVIIKAVDSNGSSSSALAFLTTFKASKRLTTHYTAGTSRSNTYSSGQKNIAVFKDAGTGNINIYSVWSDNSSGVYKAYFSRSVNGGSSFDLPMPVDDDTLRGEQFSPSIAVDAAGDVFIVWEDRGEGDSDILFRKYDNTTGFEPTKQINPDITGSLDQDTSPSIAVYSDEIYVIWEHRENPGDNYPDIYFARSSNLGSTFSDRTYLSLAGRRPAVGMDPAGTAYAVWEDLGEELVQFPAIPTRIKLRKITGGTPGASLEFEVTSGYNARYPSIAVDPACNTISDPVCDVYVAWQRVLVSEPKFAGEIISSYDIDMTIVDGGTLGIIKTTLSVPDSGSSGSFGGSAYPALAADDTNIYMVWDDWRNGTKDIYFSKSSDGGTFTTNRIVNDNTDNSSGVTWREKPGIAAADGKAYVIWTDYRNTRLSTTSSPNDVFFAVEQ